jgi:hypothetical protein
MLQTRGASKRTRTLRYARPDFWPNHSPSHRRHDRWHRRTCSLRSVYVTTNDANMIGPTPCSANTTASPIQPLSIDVVFPVGKSYKSLSSLSWKDVPPLAILTGKNDAGKTQLLELLGFRLTGTRHSSSLLNEVKVGGAGTGDPGHGAPASIQVRSRVISSAVRAGNLLRRSSGGISRSSIAPEALRINGLSSA